MIRGARYIGATGLLLAAGGCHLLLGLDEYELDTTVCSADGVRNGRETDVDCGGGACPACADQLGCTVGTDCVSGVCTGGRCAAPSCSDTVKNGDEIDVDCGGSCGVCGPGQVCTKNEECKSGVCTGGACQSTCQDLVKGGQETDVDCGGPDCPACPNDKGCATGGDCQSGVCKATVCLDHHVWSKKFGGMGSAEANSLRIDAGGNAVVASSFDGMLDFGGGTLTAAGTSQDIYIARFDTSGNHLWSKSFGDPEYQIVFGLDLDKSSNIFITGPMNGSTNFGGGVLTSNGDSDIFVAKIRSSGVYELASHYGDSMGQFGTGVAIDSKDATILVGGFSGKVNFWSGTMTSAGGDDVFITKETTDIAGRWSRRFGDAASQIAYAVDTDSANNIIVSGRLNGSIAFGGAPLVAVGQNDLFLVKLGPNGNTIWSRGFGSSTSDIGAFARTDDDDNIILAGYVAGAIDMGGGELADGGSRDILLAKFDPFGKHLWSKRFGDTDEQSASGVAVDSAGNILITGEFEGTIDLGGGPLISAGGTDVFVAKFDRYGKHMWSKRFGDADYQHGQSIAAYNAEYVLVAGKFDGTINFGGGPLTSADGGDLFLVKLRTP